MSKPLSEMSLQELWNLFPIVLKKHNSKYKQWYISESKDITKIVGKENITRINHIGSSAVEGLLAKPIVDILLEVKNDCNISELERSLTNNNWICMTQKDSPYFQISFNKGYTSKGFAKKVFHLHVRYSGDWDELYFRDYLQIHKDIADEYAKLKEKLIEEYKNNRDGYTEAKKDFVKKYSDKAKKEFKSRYLPLKI